MSYFKLFFPLLFFARTTTVFALKKRYCNRGFCYTKNEQDPSASKRLDPLSNHEHHQIKRTGFDFCTDRDGHLMDCEIFEILGTEHYMPLETTISENNARSKKNYSKNIMNENSSLRRKSEEKEILMKHHIPWEKEAMQGHCFDYDAGISFDCKLVSILEEGLVLIEDLRLGGVFAAQPKSGFTTRKDNNYQPHLEPVHTPEVLCGSNVDPVQDWRTNVEINLEGM